MGNFNENQLYIPCLNPHKMMEGCSTVSLAGEARLDGRPQAGPGRRDFKEAGAVHVALHAQRLTERLRGLLGSTGMPEG